MLRKPVSVFFLKSTYQVALQTDKLHPGLQVPVCVAAQDLDELHQVRAELVASFQDTQHDYVVVPEVLPDVVGQTLDPAGENRSLKTTRTCVDAAHVSSDL